MQARSGLVERSSVPRTAPFSAMRAPFRQSIKAPSLSKTVRPRLPGGPSPQRSSAGCVAKWGRAPAGRPGSPNALQTRHAVTQATSMSNRSNCRALQGLRLPAWRQPRSAQQRFSTALHALLVCCLRGLCFCVRMLWMVWQRVLIFRCMRSYLSGSDTPTPHLTLIRPRTR